MPQLQLTQLDGLTQDASPLCPQPGVLLAAPGVERVVVWLLVYRRRTRWVVKQVVPARRLIRLGALGEEILKFFLQSAHAKNPRE